MKWERLNLFIHYQWSENILFPFYHNSIKQYNFNVFRTIHTLYNICIGCELYPFTYKQLKNQHKEDPFKKFIIS